MITNELKSYILEEINKECLKEDLFKIVDLKMCASRPFKKEKGLRKAVCASAEKREDSRSFEGGECISSNRVVEEENDFEGLSSIANGPCKTFDEIFESVQRDMNDFNQMTFSDFLLHLIDKKNLKDSTVYKKAGISKQLFSIIRSDRYYVPKKKTVFAFILALELEMDTAKDLLKKAGYSFANFPTDIAVKIFIEKKIYNLVDVNIYLQELIDKGYNVELLGY